MGAREAPSNFPRRLGALASVARGLDGASPALVRDGRRRRERRVNEADDGDDDYGEWTTWGSNKGRIRAQHGVRLFGPSKPGPNIFLDNIRHALARNGPATSRRRYAKALRPSRQGAAVIVRIFISVFCLLTMFDFRRFRLRAGSASDAGALRGPTRVQGSPCTRLGLAQASQQR